MLDRVVLTHLKRPLQWLAKLLLSKGVRADQVTISGFFIGLAAIPLLAITAYPAALTCILLNRLTDGIDGELARLTQTTDRGGYLDIVLDFIFYSAVILGFALADPKTNSLAAATLIFSFVGTGTSFLAYAIMAERRGIQNLRIPAKGFYYLGGLMEGTETVLFFTLFCLLPGWFPFLAYLFASLCCITTLMRITFSYRNLDR